MIVGMNKNVLKEKEERENETQEEYTVWFYYLIVL